MRLQAVMVLGLSILLVSCGQDVASNQHRAGTRSTNFLNGDGSILSQINRDHGQSTLTYAEEIQQTLNGSLELSYRTIPDLDQDSEAGINVIRVHKLGRPQVPCGNLSEDKMNGIKARISDCKTKNQNISNSTYFWDGIAYGSAGEGLWQLVAYFAEGKELWRDVKTGMIWSEEKAAVIWCKAAGNKQVGSEFNCETTGESISICSGKSLTFLGDDIVWRLPTRNDYLQADLNGLRHVFTKDNTTVKTYWTATMDSLQNKNAWVYSFPQGQVSSASVEDEKNVRCIGVPRL